MIRHKLTPYALILAGAVLIGVALTAFASIATYLHQ